MPKRTSEPSKDKETVEQSKVLTPLQKLLQKKDVLLMIYPKDKSGYFNLDIESADERLIYGLLRDKSNIKKSLIIVLDTSGGNVYSAVKIMDCLRTKYTDISIAIPQEAKSSGTTMCFGADKLIMSSISELGPLDKPLPHPDYENEYISALDIVRSVDGTLDNAAIRLKELAIDIRKEFGLRIKSSLEIACDHVSKLMTPMLVKENIKTYNQAKRLLTIAENYGSEFLEKYMLKYIKDNKLRNRVITFIIRRFVWLYPDHAYAVRRNELRDFFFIVEDGEKLEYWNDLYKMFDQNIDTKIKLIKFLS